MDGPRILKTEVKAAISKTKNNKASGPDEIYIEMIRALEGFGVQKDNDLLNNIYDSEKFHLNQASQYSLLYLRNRMLPNVNCIELPV